MKGTVGVVAIASIGTVAYRVLSESDLEGGNLPSHDMLQEASEMVLELLCT